MPITTELAQHLLADLLREATPEPRTDEELLAEIAGILGFDVDALKGKSRQRPLVTARQIAMYVFRELTDLSYPASPASSAAATTRPSSTPSRRSSA